MSVCVQRANKHSGHAVLSLAVKAEVGKKSWKIILAARKLSVYEREIKMGTEGVSKALSTTARLIGGTRLWIEQNRFIFKSANLSPDCQIKHALQLRVRNTSE